VARLGSPQVPPRSRRWASTRATTSLGEVGPVTSLRSLSAPAALSGERGAVGPAARPESDAAAPRASQGRRVPPALAVQRGESDLPPSQRTPPAPGSRHAAP